MRENHKVPLTLPQREEIPEGGLLLRPSVRKTRPHEVMRHEDVQSITEVEGVQAFPPSFFLPCSKLMLWCVTGGLRTKRTLFQTPY